MTDFSDSELVERCLRGDDAARVLLVRRFERPVFATCLRMLRHQQDAEDVAQETLVRMCRHLASWDGSRQLLPWILAIAANRCRTALAKRSRQPAMSDTLLDPISEDNPAGREIGEELEQALGILREDQRACFALFYEQQLSVNEIAEVMQVAEGTVKTWLHRARKQLADHLRRRGFEGGAG
ncbi:MAG: RNA polymerase sigma factor [Planctomycetaceae bacterium]